MAIINPYQLYTCGDHAITIEFGNRIDAGINDWVIAAFNHFQKKPFSGIIDLIPAYSSLTLVYDPVNIKKAPTDDSVYSFVEKNILNQLKQITNISTDEKEPVNIPVCYDLSLGADLASLAAFHQLSTEEVVTIHCSLIYRVYMIGFLPGFAYMGSVDPRIVMPRLSQPRTLVPAGSVGIAGEQTGIYPFASPGGWQLIGQTPLCLFDPAKENPCLLQSGDQVRFYSITLAEFQKLQAV